MRQFVAIIFKDPDAGFAVTFPASSSISSMLDFTDLSTKP